MVESARSAGLGITIHVGEEGETGGEELGEVVEHLQVLDDLAELLAAGRALLADVDRDPEPAARAVSTMGEICL